MRQALLALACISLLVGCSESPTPTTVPVSVPTHALIGATMLDQSMGAQPRLATDPARLADDLVADERALRDPAAPEADMLAAARRQQSAYRLIGRHAEWDAITQPRVPPDLRTVYDLNVDARRQLTSMARPKATLPAWRITAPAPAEDLLASYREAESASGVGWTYLAAINLIETQFGSIDGLSTAGARGPMQFLPSTFAAYGAGTTSTRPMTASWRRADTWPPTASPTTATTRSTATTMPRLT